MWPSPNLSVLETKKKNKNYWTLLPNGQFLRFFKRILAICNFCFNTMDTNLYIKCATSIHICIYWPEIIGEITKAKAETHWDLEMDTSTVARVSNSYRNGN